MKRQNKKYSIPVIAGSIITMLFIMCMFSGRICEVYASAGSEYSWYRIATNYEPGIAVRVSPDPESTLLTRIPDGTEFFVENISGVWGYTCMPDYEGWIHLDYAEELYQAPVYFPNAEYVIESDYEPGIAVRSIPSGDGLLYTRIPNGTIFFVERICGVWGYTSDVGGYAGWIHLDYAQPIMANDPQDISSFEAFEDYKGSDEPIFGAEDDLKDDDGLWNYPTHLTCTVTCMPTTEAPLHAEPNEESSVVLRIPYGTRILVTEINGEYAFTQISGQSGWINTDYATIDVSSIEITTPDMLADVRDPENGVYIASGGPEGGVVVRPHPDDDSTILTKVKNGTKFTSNIQYGNYIYTKINGIYGWVNLNYTNPTQPFGLYGVIPETDTPYFGHKDYNPYYIHEMSEFIRAYLYLTNGFWLIRDPDNPYSDTLLAQEFYLFDIDFDGYNEVLVYAQDEDYSYHWEILDNNENDIIWTIARDILPKPGNAGHSLSIINNNCLKDFSDRSLVGYDASWVTYIFYANGRINYLQSFIYIDHQIDGVDGVNWEITDAEYKLNGNIISEAEFHSLASRYENSDNIVYLNDGYNGVPINESTIEWLGTQERPLY